MPERKEGKVLKILYANFHLYCEIIFILPSKDLVVCFKKYLIDDIYSESTLVGAMRSSRLSDLTGSHLTFKFYLMAFTNTSHSQSYCKLNKFGHLCLQ